MKYCPNCREHYVDEIIYCPICNEAPLAEGVHKIEESQKVSTQPQIFRIIGICIILIVIFVGATCGNYYRSTSGDFNFALMAIIWVVGSLPGLALLIIGLTKEK